MILSVQSIIIILAIVIDHTNPRGERESWDLCHSSGPWKSEYVNCTSMGEFYYYDPANQTCRMYHDCINSDHYRFTSMDMCIRNCLGEGQIRCRRKARMKAPERCHWIRAKRSTTRECPQYQLHCTGGPCATHPCNEPCQICTYNLEFTIWNCSLLTYTKSDNGKCPPPFRCERDIRCDRIGVSRDHRLPSDVQPAASSSISTGSPIMTDGPLTPVSSTNPPACLLPVKYMACSTQDTHSKLIWYFDLQSRLCRRFYGTHTCSGNDNGFQTKEECLRVCHKHENCPPLRKDNLPVGCHYEERKGLDGCWSLVAVCIEKPGRCPVPSGRPNYNTRICYKECQRDSDCKDEMKCCANGCASLCLAPAPPIFPIPRVEEGAGPWSNHHEKPGMCPVENHHMINGRNCSEKCEIDADCPGTYKCCSMGQCGRVCISLEELDQSHRHHLVEEVDQSHKPDPTNPCETSSCLSHERCIPLSNRTHFPSPTYFCHPVDLLSHFDPCAHGKDTCGPDELCIHEPQTCLTSPCSQYRCVPRPTNQPVRFERITTTVVPIQKGNKDVHGGKDLHLANDPCSPNPCRPCQRCSRVHLDGEMEAESVLLPYRCEDHCPGDCEECGLNGRCVYIKQPHICKTNEATNPCQDRTCGAYPMAKCVQDPCHCLRAKFVLENGTRINSDECNAQSVT